MADDEKAKLGCKVCSEVGTVSTTQNAPEHELSGE
jgi:hypothetical protein